MSLYEKAVAGILDHQHLVVKELTQEVMVDAEKKILEATALGQTEIVIATFVLSESKMYAGVMYDYKSLTHSGMWRAISENILTQLNGSDGQFTLRTRFDETSAYLVVGFGPLVDPVIQTVMKGIPKLMNFMSQFRN